MYWPKDCVGLLEQWLGVWLEKGLEDWLEVCVEKQWLAE
jgi:hypothetical protein